MSMKRRERIWIKRCDENIKAIWQFCSYLFWHRRDRGLNSWNYGTTDLRDYGIMDLEDTVSRNYGVMDLRNGMKCEGINRQVGN